MNHKRFVLLNGLVAVAMLITACGAPAAAPAAEAPAAEAPAAEATKAPEAEAPAAPAEAAAPGQPRHAAGARVRGAHPDRAQGPHHPGSAGA